MRKENDLEPVKTICRITTMDIFDHYRETYSKEDIDNLTESIIRFGFMLNGLDFGLFKQKAIAGEYKNRFQIIDGKEFRIQFFRLSPDVYLDWFQEYIFKRGETFANNSHLVHKQVDEQVKSEPISKKTVEMLKKLAETVKPKPSEPIYSTDTNEAEKQSKELQKYLTKEFEEIWEKQGKNEFDRGRGKYVFAKQGSRMLSDYLELRFKDIYSEIYKDYAILDKVENPISLSDFIFESINKIING